MWLWQTANSHILLARQHPAGGTRRSLEGASLPGRGWKCLLGFYEAVAVTLTIPPDSKTGQACVSACYPKLVLRKIETCWELRMLL